MCACYLLGSIVRQGFVFVDGGQKGRLVSVGVLFVGAVDSVWRKANKRRRSLDSLMVCFVSECLQWISASAECHSQSHQTWLANCKKFEGCGIIRKRLAVRRLSSDARHCRGHMSSRGYTGQQAAHRKEKPPLQQRTSSSCWPYLVAMISAHIMHRPMQSGMLPAFVRAPVASTPSSVSTQLLAPTSRVGNDSCQAMELENNGVAETLRMTIGSPALMCTPWFGSLDADHPLATPTEILILHCGFVFTYTRSSWICACLGREIRV